MCGWDGMPEMDSIFRSWDKTSCYRITTNLLVIQVPWWVSKEPYTQKLLGRLTKNKTHGPRNGQIKPATGHQACPPPVLAGLLSCGYGRPAGAHVLRRDRHSCATVQAQRVPSQGYVPLQFWQIRQMAGHRSSGQRRLCLGLRAGPGSFWRDSRFHSCG